MTHDAYSTKRVTVWEQEKDGQKGYAIKYQDGYVSWCPKAAFDRDYQPITAMSFGHALHALKAGHRVARAGWNGKGMWLSLSGPLGPREIASENFWSKNNSDYADANGGSATVLPCITMKTATEEILMGWLASQTDMLADDWTIVE
jgi:hypothetical protein